MTQSDADELMRDATYLLNHRAESVAQSVELHGASLRQYEKLVSLIVKDGLDPWNYKHD